MPVRLEIEFYGASRQWCEDTHVLDLDPATHSATVLDVLVLLAKRYPDFAEHRFSVAVAVQDEIVQDSFVVAEGMRLAIIPPVSGG